MGTSIGKILTLAIWVAIIFNLVQPFEGQVSQWLNWLGIFLLVAHSIECIVFSKQVQIHHADNKAYGYLMILIFGVVHAGQWKKS